MKKILPALLATVAAVAFTAPSAHAASKYIDVYLMSGSTLKIHDQEVFSDEEQSFNLTGYVGRFLNQKTAKPQFLWFERCAGGEVRVRITLQRTGVSNPGSLQSRIDLFEGASCSNTDLDGFTTWDFMDISPGYWFEHQFFVGNQDEGGDWAIANLKVLPVEAN